MDFELLNIAVFWKVPGHPGTGVTHAVSKTCARPPETNAQFNVNPALAHYAIMTQTERDQSSRLLKGIKEAWTGRGTGDRSTEPELWREEGRIRTRSQRRNGGWKTSQGPFSPL